MTNGVRIDNPHQFNYRGKIKETVIKLAAKYYSDGELKQVPFKSNFLYTPDGIEYAPIEILSIKGHIVGVRLVDSGRTKEKAQHFIDAVNQTQAVQDIRRKLREEAEEKAEESQRQQEYAEYQAEYERDFNAQLEQGFKAQKNYLKKQSQGGVIDLSKFNNSSLPYATKQTDFKPFEVNIKGRTYKFGIYIGLTPETDTHYILLQIRDSADPKKVKSHRVRGNSPKQAMDNLLNFLGIADLSVATLVSLTAISYGYELSAYDVGVVVGQCSIINV